MDELASLEHHAHTELTACADEAGLRAWHTRYFGKQGEVTLAFKQVGKLPPAERKAYGQQANQLKERLTRRLRGGPGRTRRNAPWSAVCPPRCST